MGDAIHHQTKPHIVMVPTPGMGHLIPLTELAKRLVDDHNFSVSFLIPSDGSPSIAIKSVLDELPETITYTFLSPVNFDDQPEDVDIETIISLTIFRSLSYLREELQRITSSKRVVALVVDLFGTDAFDVAKGFGIPPYIFFLSNAHLLQLLFHLSSLHESYIGEFGDLPQPLCLPGCVPFPGSDILSPLQDKKSGGYKWFLHHSRRYSLAEGILVNTFIDLEPNVLKVLMTEQLGIPPIYPVGPVTKSSSSKMPVDDGSGCLKWLDDQPPESVLFVSFGSGGNLPYEQLIELAYGLEMSEKKFIWVVKSPSETANASFFKHTSKDPFDFLPDGFVNRISGSGLLVPSWAPQIQILSHGSTGGFLSHCGWNSTLESIVCGIPMITWPLFAEQRMNTVMLVEDAGVGVRPKPNENGLIMREEISRVVRTLMGEGEGKSLRSKMRELKDGAAKVLSENGSSKISLLDVVNKWKNPAC
ncbi:hypothetical protein C5167_044836 [Papaver somniferum]|uniref:hydroquinone glucosyltransferase-like n=1 Tax=Papaver somniferum TaxID=3469 RepID=UPI000E702AA8|nr:hydroquinone glucosyltransferase-like [Papaver somniferum]RZC90207.1 hypothetical protein C5167_044836 [Papaver somniferum]